MGGLVLTTGPPMLVIYVWIRVAWAVRPMKWTKTAGAEAEVMVAVGQTEDRPRGYTLIYIGSGCRPRHGLPPCHPGVLCRACCLQAYRSR